MEKNSVLCDKHQYLMYKELILTTQKKQYKQAQIHVKTFAKEEIKMEHCSIKGCWNTLQLNIQGFKIEKLFC